MTSASPSPDRAAAPAPALSIHGLCFSWPGSAQSCIDIPAFSIARGERVFMHGASGSGKSTLLFLLAGMLAPGAGSLQVAGTDLAELTPATRDRFRADHLGIIFQQFNLLPFLSVLDNVLLGCRFSEQRRRRAGAESGGLRHEAARLLDRLNIGSALRERPVGQLSVGQQQRVAATRALIGRPELLIADEPTSALDERNQQEFIALVLGECSSPCSLLLVSHDLRMASSFDRSVALADLNRACLEDRS